MSSETFNERRRTPRTSDPAVRALLWLATLALIVSASTWFGYDRGVEATRRSVICAAPGTP